MATHIKPDGISGLNTGHSLYSKVKAFYEFGQLNKELLSDTALTTTAVYVDDPDIGDALTFDATADAIAETLAITGSCTVLIVARLTGGRADGDSSSVKFVDVESGGNQVTVEYRGFNPYGIRAKHRANYSGTTTTEGDGFSTDDEFDDGHAFAFLLDLSGTNKSVRDGTVSATTGTAPAVPFNGNPVLAFMSFLGATASVNVGAIAVLGALTETEMQTATTTPWGFVAVAPAITSVDTDNEINPSQTDVSVAISNAAASVTSLDQINLGGTVSGETITGGTNMLNLRWNGGTPLFDVPAGMTIANGYDIHVKYTP